MIGKILAPGVALVLAVASGNPAQASTEVAIETGELAGSTEDGVATWKGIPFAAPPIGELRWRAPQPAAKWNGIRDATRYGPDCMQVPFPSDAAPLGTSPAEDCLYVNVWKPVDASGKLPVVFWIYGGGFVNGGASPPTYSGRELARQGVIFVSANYRVGRFGTFALPQLTAEDSDRGLLGNYGILDQIAALKWVQRNIAAFGGDPDNVTVIGESAGGMSIHMLATSPMATGLFSKAVVMSGGDGRGMGQLDLAAAEKIGVAFARSKGIATDGPDALAKLRALSAEEITDGLNLAKLFAPAGERTFASPYADGTIVVDAAKAYASGEFVRVPMMLGATSADIGGRTGPMIAGARDLSAEISSHGVPVYAYRFSYVAQSLGHEGAQHASDIPFFFDTQAVKYGSATSERDNTMGETISAYIVNFAKTGDPNGPGLARWDRYDAARDVIMDFAENGQAVSTVDPWGVELSAASRPGS